MNNLFSTFYTDTFSFVAFGLEHNLILIFSLIFGFLFIFKGYHNRDIEKKRKYALLLCLSMMIVQTAKPLIKLYLGNFNIEDDLPLHLCNLMPFAMFIAFYMKSRLVWAIFFFWIIAGTSQSLVTPTLTEKLPHYDAIRYWLVHAGLVIISIYGAVVMGWRLEVKDIFLSSIAMNITAIIIYPINVMLGANYFYLNAKPGVDTFYSLLPEWPIYILHLEWIMLLLFTIVFMIFKFFSGIYSKPIPG